MKTFIDKNGRKLYKFSHSVHQGGYMYARKINSSEIVDKGELRKALFDISAQLGLIDVTMKIYDNIFFLFCLIPPSLAPQKLISMIQENISRFGDWENEYIWTGVYDLQEKFVKEYLEKIGFDYDNG